MTDSRDDPWANTKPDYVKALYTLADAVENHHGDAGQLRLAIRCRQISAKIEEDRINFDIGDTTGSSTPTSGEPKSEPKPGRNYHMVVSLADSCATCCFCCYARGAGHICVTGGDGRVMASGSGCELMRVQPGYICNFHERYK